MAKFREMEGKPEAPLIMDPRFKSQQSDPRFQKVPKNLKKLKVDERFKAMLDSNSSFARKSVTDKYGRPIKHNIKEDLSKFYELDEDEAVSETGNESLKDADDSSSEEEETVTKAKKVQKNQVNEKGKGQIASTSLKDRKNVKANLKTSDERADEIPKKSKTSSKQKKGSDAETKSKKATQEKKSKADKPDPRFADPVSKKLKDQDLRTAMMDWSSSSSSDGEDSDADDSDEEEAKFLATAVDVSQPVVPVESFVAAGEETRRLAVRRRGSVRALHPHPDSVSSPQTPFPVFLPSTHGRARARTHARARILSALRDDGQPLSPPSVSRSSRSLSLYWIQARLPIPSLHSSLLPNSYPLLSIPYSFSGDGPTPSPIPPLSCLAGWLAGWLPACRPLSLPPCLPASLPLFC